MPGYSQDAAVMAGEAQAAPLLPQNDNTEADDDTEADDGQWDPQKMRDACRSYIKQHGLRTSLLDIASMVFAALVNVFTVYTGIEYEDPLKRAFNVTEVVDIDKQEFGILLKLKWDFAFLEVAVVWFSFVMSAICFLILWKVSDDCSVARRALHHLENAGSFSLLWFLPLPQKLVYWYKHKDDLSADYIFHPWVTTLHYGEANEEGYKPQFTIYHKDHWDHVYKVFEKQRDNLDWVKTIRCCLGQWECIFNGILDIGFYVVVLVAWLYATLLPAMIVVCILASPFAAMRKMSAFPGYTNLLEPPFDMECARNWVAFLGVLNQMSKMWSPKHIEIAGFRRHINPRYVHDAQEIKETAKKKIAKKKTSREFLLAFESVCWQVYTQGDEDARAKSKEVAGVPVSRKIRGLSLLANMDVETVGFILTTSIEKYPPPFVAKVVKYAKINDTKEKIASAPSFRGLVRGLTLP